MDSIYSILKNVQIEAKNENNRYAFFLIISLFVSTIALPLGVNNVVLGAFIVQILIQNKGLKFNKNNYLILPIILYLWMCCSYFWTIDTKATLKALPKEVALLILPLIFLFIPKFDSKTRDKILKYYSVSIVLLVLFFLVRAIIRFLLSGNIAYFFYHGEYDSDTGLVPKVLNAVHVSIYVSFAFFIIIGKAHRRLLDNVTLLVLALFIFLLSSKVIVVTFSVLLFFYLLVFAKLKKKNRRIILFGAIVFVAMLFSISKVKQRFEAAFTTPLEQTAINDGVIHVTPYEAWNNKTFGNQYYFGGVSLRVYQARLFFEFLDEEPIFWKGFGLNASEQKLIEKEKQYNLYNGYGKFNFHNQYFQNFAELGVVGFILLIILLFFSLKKAIISKDFRHIAFTILMISVFLTESFLWRQRGVVFFTIFYCLFMSQSDRK